MRPKLDKDRTRKFKTRYLVRGVDNGRGYAFWGSIFLSVLLST
jgi:hypothetical protein